MDTSEKYIKMCASLPAVLHNVLEFEPVYINDEPHGLPRLDTLLDIITGDKNQIATVSKLFRYKECAIVYLYPDWQVHKITLEQLALTYIMYTNHRMIWYEGNWEKVE